jgi:peptidoglycan/LPS O-acetylase OafA/YrhL
MKHIREFDGLRGLLALWVLASHVIEVGPFSSAAASLRPNLAVDLFIILSGFVIFHLLSTGEDYRTFITRRWFRLFPTFGVCFLVALVPYAVLGFNDEDIFGIGHTRKLLPYLVTHATMLHGAVPEQLLPHAARAILVPAWSISLEWQFYLLAPLLFLFVFQTARTARAATIVVCALIAARVFCELGRHTGWLTFDMQAVLPLKLEFFAVGIGSFGIWRWLSQRQVPLAIPRSFYVLIVPVLLIVARRSVSIALWLGGMVLLANLYFGNRDLVSRVLAAVLNCSTAQFLGRISYPLYLLHVPALVLVREILRVNQGTASPVHFQLALVVSGLAASIAGAWLLHTTVEKPLMNFAKRLTNSWKVHPAPEVVAVRP